MLSAASWAQRQGHWQPVTVLLSLGSLIQGAGFMPWEWVMDERVLNAQA